MKKILFTFFAVAAFTFVSCGDKQKAAQSEEKSAQSEEKSAVKATDSEAAEILAGVQEQAAEENAQCPTDMGNGMTLKEVAVMDGNMCYTISYDESASTIAQLSEKADEMKEVAKTMLKQSPELLALAVKAGLGYVYNYEGEKSGETLTITLTVDDLADLIN